MNVSIKPLFWKLMKKTFDTASKHGPCILKSISYLSKSGNFLQTLRVKFDRKYSSGSGSRKILANGRKFLLKYTHTHIYMHYIHTHTHMYTFIYISLSMIRGSKWGHLVSYYKISLQQESANILCKELYHEYFRLCHKCSTLPL